jgi:hypothetical protein
VFNPEAEGGSPKFALCVTVDGEAADNEFVVDGLGVAIYNKLIFK